MCSKQILHVMIGGAQLYDYRKQYNKGFLSIGSAVFKHARQQAAAPCPYSLLSYAEASISWLL